MYFRARSELKEDQAYDYGWSLGSPLRDAFGSFFLITHPPLELYITWS